MSDKGNIIMNVGMNEITFTKNEEGYRASFERTWMSDTMIDTFQLKTNELFSNNSYIRMRFFANGKTILFIIEVGIKP